MRLVDYEDISNISYQQAWDLQSRYHECLVNQKMEIRKGNKSVPDLPHKIFFCEHNPVFTLGKSGSLDNLLLNESELALQAIEFFKINRGGDITYHGPGQITGYPILDLDYIYTDIHRYIRDMEEAVIKTLRFFGILGERIDGYTGVWIKAKDIGQPHRKICAIGVHMSRWVSLHGFALNVNTDLSYFEKIIPCGIHDEDKTVTSIAKELNLEVNINQVKQILLNELCDIYGLTLINPNYSLENLFRTEMSANSVSSLDFPQSP